jgi:hypothetical protein
MWFLQKNTTSSAATVVKVAASTVPSDKTKKPTVSSVLKKIMNECKHKD